MSLTSSPVIWLPKPQQTRDIPTLSPPRLTSLNIRGKQGQVIRAAGEKTARLYYH